MTKHYEVTALGEVLIDFTENGSSAQGNPMYEANPGGAPCNVLAMLQKFGHKTAFLGKVGEDIFGRRLEIVLKEAGIDTAGLCMDPTVRTTLAFVEKKADGDRDFFFLPESGRGYDAAYRGTAGADLKGHPHISFWHALDDG